MSRNLIKFLFNDSQQMELGDALGEAFDAIDKSEELTVRKKPLAALLKKLEVSAEVQENINGLFVEYEDHVLYAHDLGILQAPETASDLGESGWVAVGQGDLSTTAQLPRYRISFIDLGEEEDAQTDKKLASSFEKDYEAAIEFAQTPVDDKRDPGETEKALKAAGKPGFKESQTNRILRTTQVFEKSDVVKLATKLVKHGGLKPTRDMVEPLVDHLEACADDRGYCQTDAAELSVYLRESFDFVGDVSQVIAAVQAKGVPAVGVDDESVMVHFEDGHAVVFDAYATGAWGYTVLLGDAPTDGAAVLDGPAEDSNVDEVAAYIVGVVDVCTSKFGTVVGEPAAVAPRTAKPEPAVDDESLPLGESNWTTSFKVGDCSGTFIDKTVNKAQDATAMPTYTLERGGKKVKFWEFWGTWTYKSAQGEEVQFGSAEELSSQLVADGFPAFDDVEEAAQAAVSTEWEDPMGHPSQYE